MPSFYDVSYNGKFDDRKKLPLPEDISLDERAKNMTQKARDDMRTQHINELRAVHTQNEQIKIFNSSFDIHGHFAVCEALTSPPLNEDQKKLLEVLKNHRENLYALDHFDDINRVNKIQEQKSEYNPGGVSPKDFITSRQNAKWSLNNAVSMTNREYRIDRLFTKNQIRYATFCEDPKKFVDTLNHAMLNYDVLKTYHDSKGFFWKLTHFGKNRNINKTLDKYKRTFKELGITKEDIAAVKAEAEKISLLEGSGIEDVNAAKDELSRSFQRSKDICKEKFKALQIDADLSVLDQNPKLEQNEALRSPLEEHEQKSLFEELDNEKNIEKSKEISNDKSLGEVKKDNIKVD